MTDIETTENVFEALDLPYHAKAADVLTKFHGMALTPAVTKELRSAIAAALKAERAEEREECAETADEHDCDNHDRCDCRRHIAIAIRNRGETS